MIVRGNPISIKTITGKYLGGVKLIWTVDSKKALEFGQNYKPACDMLLTHINWNGKGGLYYFSKELQNNLLAEIRKDKYLKLPKPDTNPRGVEMSTLAIRILAEHPQSLKIPTKWEKKEIKFNPYERWIELWK